MNIDTIKHTLFLRAYSAFKIPLFAFCSPTIVEMSDKRMVLKIPLNYCTKNHLGVMYFGALNIGGEACIGAFAFLKIMQAKRRIDFLFRDYKAVFHKRADGDVHFICDQLEKVVDLIEKAKTSQERFNVTINSYAIVPGKSTTEHVADFEVTLTVKGR